jgi:hypothetical protein
MIGRRLGHYEIVEKLGERHVTPDGERFVMIRDTESWPTRIQIVQNGFEELRARVPLRLDFHP